MKTYADNSHVHMDAAADYAQQLFNYGCTYAQFAAEWPHMAASDWGVDVALALLTLKA
jgi:hypothetical protein